MSELYHFNPFHDRKTGRFTDKNGNLTTAGIVRYKELLARDHSKATQFFDTTGAELEKTKAGVYQRDGDDYIKKGSTFTRFTTKDEPLDHKRKYVSITEDDRERYGEVAREGMLGFKDIDNMLEVQYTAKKDLRVAQGHAVVDYIMEHYGDLTVSEYGKLSKDDVAVIRTALDTAFGGNKIKNVYDDPNEFDLSYDLELKNYKGKDKKVLEAAVQYATTRDNVLSTLYQDVLMASPSDRNPTLDHFAKLGYDAIVDVEDAEWANYPLILLNPGKSVKYTDPSLEQFANAKSEVLSRVSNDVHPTPIQPPKKAEVKKRGNLTDEEAVSCIHLAVDLRKEARQYEPKITRDVVESVTSSGSNMYGLEHRMKQPSSLAAKIGADAKEKNVSFADAAKQVKDVVRYTSIADNENFVESYRTTKKNLESLGYTETKQKNYFKMFRDGEVKHKSVQCTYTDPDGHAFEIQYHTPESQAAKELKLPLYEKRRQAGLSDKKKAELEKKMEELAGKVPYPKNIFDI